MVQGRVSFEREAPIPVPGTGEAIVRTTRVAVCHAAADSIRAPRGPDRTLGREFVGTVERIGPGSGPGPLRGSGANLVGKRVVGSASRACGSCDRCRSGLSGHCRDRRTLGEPGTEGCFADYFTVPVSSLVEVPPGIGDDEAVLSSTFAAASHLARAVPISPRILVSVIGDGAVGLVTAALLASRAETVRILTLRSSAAMVCEKWGLRHRPAGEAGRRHDQDLVVDTEGSDSSMSLAVGLARPRGMVFVSRTTGRAGGPGPSEDVCGAIAELELTVRGVRGEDFPGGVAILAGGSIPVAPLVASRLTLEQVPGCVVDPGFDGMVKVIASVPPPSH